MRMLFIIFAASLFSCKPAKQDSSIKVSESSADEPAIMTAEDCLDIWDEPVSSRVGMHEERLGGLSFQYYYDTTKIRGVTTATDDLKWDARICERPVVSYGIRTPYKYNHKRETLDYLRSSAQGTGQTHLWEAANKAYRLHQIFYELMSSAEEVELTKKELENARAMTEKYSITYAIGRASGMDVAGRGSDTGSRAIDIIAAPSVTGGGITLGGATMGIVGSSKAATAATTAAIAGATAKTTAGYATGVAIATAGSVVIGTGLVVGIAFATFEGFIHGRERWKKYKFNKASENYEQLKEEGSGLVKLLGQFTRRKSGTERRQVYWLYHELLLINGVRLSDPRNEPINNVLHALKQKHAVWH